ncbi:amidohydrolase family protein [Pseudonocardia xishanensis]|uniref:Amidohydrolase family protein n=1 Tax=Pseudonocardia xishanensis TaxID=630995 RepID=A0ABP8RSS5_9PSEU
MHRLVDAHVHGVDFLQRVLPADELQAVLAGPDGPAGVVLFGLPMKKKWAQSEPRTPHYYLDGNDPCSYFPLTDQLVADLYLQLPDDLRARVAPTVCGFDPTDRLAVEHLEWAFDRYPFWAGIGEVMLRHDDLTNLTAGEHPTASHPALDAVFDFARRHDRPLALHHDSASAGRPAEHEYVPQLGAMLDRHPRTTVVWCHAGVARRIEPHDQAALVDELLDAHPGLHIDVSWSLLDRIVGPDEDGRSRQVDPDWVRLIDRHPDRFVLGSDSVAQLDDLRPLHGRLSRLVDAVHPAHRDALAHGNAERLWFARR